MTTSLECPVCAATAHLRDAALPGYVEGELYQVYACSGCHASFVTPRRANPELYNRIYELADAIPGYDRYYRYARLVAASSDPLETLCSMEDVYWSVGQALGDLAPATSRILEIGSGLGYLTYALAERGYSAVGLDVSKAAVDAARGRFPGRDIFIHADLQTYANSHAATYDAVVACELLEHLEDPVEFVRRAFALVKPGGRLILTTPNRTFYEQDILWETETPPVHFWWFSEASLEVLGQVVGARTSFVDFEPYQKKNPLYLGEPLRGEQHRSPFLSAALQPTEEARIRQRRARIGDAFPPLRTNGLVQRLRGRRRVTGPRRTVLCAIIHRPSVNDGPSSVDRTSLTTEPSSVDDGRR